MIRNRTFLALSVSSVLKLPHEGSFHRRAYRELENVPLDRWPPDIQRPERAEPTNLRTTRRTGAASSPIRRSLPPFSSSANRQSSVACAARLRSEHRAARRLKRRRIGKHRDAQRQRTQRPQRVQRVAKRHTGVALAHVLVEVEVRQRRHNQRVGGKFFKQARHAHQQLRQLKTGERPRHADAAVELRRLASPLPRQPRNQQRVKPVRTVQTQHLLPFRQQPRQEIVEQPRRLRPPIKHRQPGRRQRPGLS